MGSGAMIYVPSFIKIGSGIQKLIWGETQRERERERERERGAHTQQCDLISLRYFFFQNKESRLKKLQKYTVCS
jgi:hypothetical protein